MRRRGEGREEDGRGGERRGGKGRETIFKPSEQLGYILHSSFSLSINPHVCSQKHLPSLSQDTESASPPTEISQPQRVDDRIQLVSHRRALFLPPTRLLNAQSLGWLVLPT